MNLQETPETISVFGLLIRTTCALEGYNGVLGRKIAKKGHFFKFVRALLIEERDKSYDVKTLVSTGGLSSNPQKKKDKVIFFYSFLFIF